MIFFNNQNIYQCDRIKQKIYQDIVNFIHAFVLNTKKVIKFRSYQDKTLFLILIVIYFHVKNSTIILQLFFLLNIFFNIYKFIYLPKKNN